MVQATDKKIIFLFKISLKAFLCTESMSLWKHINIAFILLQCLIFSPELSIAQDKAEMRGVWVATLLNIDWPSTSTLSTLEQKQEVISILDHHKSVGINAIFLQVRPAGDAFYDSSTEPWSQWLTGEQGKTPNPMYDPLQFWIEQCHLRGMELHAWFNPFRAAVTEERALLVSDHVARQNPDWTIVYAGRMYFNPGIPEVHKYLEKVIMEVVTKYDIDGVHFDDYFYPYKVSGQEFQDHDTFKKYGQDFNTVNDWRRQNISSFIKQISHSINLVKPEIRFGVSPSGVWRNKSVDLAGSNTRAGQTAYDDLYADVLLWMKEGWIDYLAPQIYWHIGYELADYKVLLDWWSQHSYGRHIYIGQSAYKIRRDADFTAWQDPSELPRHLRLNKYYPQVKGNIYFNSSALRTNALGVVDSLKYNYHRYHALVPPMEYKPAVTLGAPYLYRISHGHKQLTIHWSADQIIGSRYQIVYRYEGQYKPDGGDPGKIIALLPPETTSYVDIPPRKGYYTYVVSVVSITNHESEISTAMTINYRKRKPRKRKAES